MEIKDLCESIDSGHFEAVKRRISIHPQHTNRASSIGHPCLRRLVYQRTRWQDAQPHSARLQSIYDEGNLHEPDIMRKLQEAGYQVVHQQRPFFHEELNLSGHVDGALYADGEEITVEGKSTSQGTWDEVSDYRSGFRGMEDMLESDRWYVRGYVYQVTVYLKCTDNKHAIIVFKHKNTGEIKLVPIEFREDIWGEIEGKCRAINKHVEEKTLPDRILYDPALCGDCPYSHICAPPVINPEIQLTGQNEWFVLKTLKELEEINQRLKPLEAEKRKLEGIKKNVFKDRVPEGEKRAQILVGSELIVKLTRVAGGHVEYEREPYNRITLEWLRR